VTRPRSQETDTGQESFLRRRLLELQPDFTCSEVSVEYVILPTFGILFLIAVQNTDIDLSYRITVLE